jgi:hypothetical protein
MNGVNRILFGDKAAMRSYSVGDMRDEAGREVSRWYSNTGEDALGGLRLSRIAALDPSARMLFQTVESLKTTVNRQNFVLNAMIKRHPGILDELV